MFVMIIECNVYDFESRSFSRARADSALFVVVFLMCVVLLLFLCLGV